MPCLLVLSPLVIPMVVLVDITLAVMSLSVVSVVIDKTLVVMFPLVVSMVNGNTLVVMSLFSVSVVVDKPSVVIFPLVDIIPVVLFVVVLSFVEIIFTEVLSTVVDGTVVNTRSSLVVSVRITVEALKERRERFYVTTGFRRLCMLCSYI